MFATNFTNPSSVTSAGVNSETPMQQNIRTTVPKQTFHLILCRNLVFTYFDESLRQSVLHQIVQQLQPGGFLMLGKRESLPDGFPAVMLYSKNLYRRACSE